MAITVRQIRSEVFKENAARSVRGKSGVREFKVSGAATLDEVIFKDVSGLPKDGEVWSSEVPDLICVQVTADWWSVSRAGEDSGHIKVTAQYGPPEMAVLSSDPNPRVPGEKWCEYGTETISQQIMYADNVSGGGQVAEPIENGRGFTVNVGVLSLEICKTYARNTAPPVVAFLDLMRPPRVNALAYSTPKLWGMDFHFDFAAGQALYQGHAIERINGLCVVRHRILASSDWKVSWAVENDKGEKTGERTGRVYRDGDFSILS